MKERFKVPRRAVLAGLASCTLMPLRAGAVSDGRSHSLRSVAKDRGLFWGAAVPHAALKRDAEFAELLADECAVVTPEWEMKWTAIESHRGRRNFASADAIVKFARDHRLKVRGHALLWHRSIPDWAGEALKSEGGWDVVAGHFEAMLRRYGGDSVIHWDVLNEVVEPKHKRPDGLRISPFLQIFGPDYIGRALEVAHAAAPSMPLYLNEYGVDYDGPVEQARRTALLRLVATLKKSGAPLHGVGIQGHLRLDNSKFSASALRRFLAELASHDVKITITELDVRERDRSLPLAERDRLVAAEASRYLDVVLDEPAVEGVVAWGLSDRYSWLSPAKLTSTGVRNRGLPFDQSLAAKPLKDTIVAALQRRHVR